MGRRSAAPLIPTQPKAVFSWASFETAYGVCRIFCTRALQHLPLVTYEDRHQTRDFVHVDDVVEANMLVLEKDEARPSTSAAGVQPRFWSMRAACLNGFQTPPDSMFPANIAAVTPATVFPALKNWGVSAGGRSMVSTTSSPTIWSGLTVQGGFPPVPRMRLPICAERKCCRAQQAKQSDHLSLFRTLQRCAPR